MTPHIGAKMVPRPFNLEPWPQDRPTCSQDGPRPPLFGAKILPKITNLNQNGSSPGLCWGLCCVLRLCL
eukprot:10563986-Karenia_brevis.AAC.1